MGFSPFPSAVPAAPVKAVSHLVVEDAQAVQGVQVLLQQGCPCRVQVHLIQLQHGHGHPEQSLVHRGVLQGEKESLQSQFLQVKDNQQSGGFVPLAAGFVLSHTHSRGTDAHMDLLMHFTGEQ